MSKTRTIFGNQKQRVSENNGQVFVEVSQRVDRQGAPIWEDAAESVAVAVLSTCVLHLQERLERQEEARMLAENPDLERRSGAW